MSFKVRTGTKLNIELYKTELLDGSLIWTVYAFINLIIIYGPSEYKCNLVVLGPINLNIKLALHCKTIYWNDRLSILVF